MDKVLVEAFRYNKWANLHLLDVCAKLPVVELQLTVPGRDDRIHIAPSGLG